MEAKLRKMVVRRRTEAAMVAFSGPPALSHSCGLSIALHSVKGVDKRQLGSTEEELRSVPSWQWADLALRN